MDFLFVTGMSGAGKTVAVNELEDMGYFCVDNIPSGLIGAFARLCEQSPVGGRIALVTDFRSGEQFARFPEALDQLTAEGHTYRILMLEAEDSVILRRYKENRRRHPLLEEGSAGLEAAIRTERKLLEPLRLRADYRIDTSFITIAQLRERVEQLFGDDSGKMIVTCVPEIATSSGSTKIQVSPKNTLFTSGVFVRPLGILAVMVMVSVLANSVTAAPSRVTVMSIVFVLVPSRTVT